MLCCTLWLPRKNDVRFVCTPICIVGRTRFIYIICIFFYWSALNKPEKWAVIYLCVDFTSFYNFGTVQTVVVHLVFYFIIYFIMLKVILKVMYICLLRHIQNSYTVLDVQFPKSNIKICFILIKIVWKYCTNYSFCTFPIYYIYLIWNNRLKWKTKRYNTVGTVPKVIKRIVRIFEKSISLTQIHDYSHFWLKTGTSIKSGAVKLVLWA